MLRDEAIDEKRAAAQTDSGEELQGEMR